MARYKWLALAPVLLMVMAPSFAADRDVLVGSWRLVSFEREYQTTGEREYPMGKTPTGYILFHPAGSMAVVITAEGRKAAITDQDRAGLFNSMVAYTGPYHVDGDRWITKVEVSANPAWVGTEQTRTFRVTGDRLQEITAWAARPDSRIARAVITYERANISGAERIKAMLLRPAGWSVYWSKCVDGATGVSDFLFETRGEKVVVKIATPLFNVRCEREGTIASDVVSLSGCLDPAITVRFNPNDHEYPFIGKGVNCSEYKFKAK